MYTSATLAQNIKNRAKEQNVLIRDMLSACDLSINAISQMTDKKGISSFALGRIADYLNCSVDYLLGRTDSPQIEKAAPIQLDGDGKNVMLLAGRDGQQIKIQLSDEQYQMVYKMFCSFPDADDPKL